MTIDANNTVIKSFNKFREQLYTSAFAGKGDYLAVLAFL